MPQSRNAYKKTEMARSPTEKVNLPVAKGQADPELLGGRKRELGRAYHSQKPE
jgi:hypothetical protein